MPCANFDQSDLALSHSQGEAREYGGDTRRSIESGTDVDATNGAHMLLDVTDVTGFKFQQLTPALPGVPFGPLGCLQR